MHKLHLPRLGQTMERGIILSWLKKVGEPFTIGEPLYEMEAEKATVQVEANLPGTLARVVAPEGEELPVGALLAVVADPGEVLSAAQIAAAIAEEEGGAARAVAPRVEEPAPAASAGAETARTRVMPRARVLAGQLGIDLATVQGTGPNGAISVADVERAAAGPADKGPRVRERRPLRGIARVMAEVTARSWQVPQFVQVMLIDATALAARRAAEAAEFRQRYGVALSYTDLILPAVVRAAQEVPEVNATYEGDAIVLYEDVNLSVAMDTGGGLVVPVLRRAQSLMPGELAQRLRELAARARGGGLTREDLEGGTLTVSNLGMFGVESGTPVVTAPQAAIVFVGAIVPRPLVVDGAVVPHQSFYVSTAFDHRVLDGVTAARFSAALKRNLEQSPT